MTSTCKPLRLTRSENHYPNPKEQVFAAAKMIGFKGDIFVMQFHTGLDAFGQGCGDLWMSIPISPKSWRAKNPNSSKACAYYLNGTLVINDDWGNQYSIDECDGKLLTDLEAEFRKQDLWLEIAP